MVHLENWLRFFVGPCADVFVACFTRNVPLVLAVAVLVGIFFAQLGSGFGFQRLFWNERKLAQFTAGVAATLLLAQIFFVSFLLDRADVSGAWKDVDPYAQPTVYVMCGILWTAIACAVARGVPVAFHVASVTVQALAYLKPPRWDRPSRKTPLAAPSSSWPMAAGYVVAILAIVGVYVLTGHPTNWRADAPTPLSNDAGLLPENAIEYWPTGEPLLLVCASGGGLRAAVWTAAVLAELEMRIPRLPYRIRIVAGASGGMVGAAHWVATLEKNPSNGLQHGVSLAKLVDDVARESLSPVATALMRRDIPLAFTPFPNTTSRGDRVEQQWLKNMPGGIGKSFGELRKGEKEGWRPSLIFSPIIVEDGRRLLISNLDVEPLTEAIGALFKDTPGFFRTKTFAYGGDASLSWYLSAAEIADLRVQAKALVDACEADLKAWWQAAAAGSSSVGARAAALSEVPRPGGHDGARAHECRM